MKRILSLTALFIYMAVHVQANNVRVTGVSRLTPYSSKLVEFTLSWDNSWNVNGAPANHDAVWLFVKYRDCGNVGSSWMHALLSTTMTEHTFAAGVTYAKPIVTTDKWGDPGAHNTGVLIRRNSVGRGNIVNQTCTLKLTGLSSLGFTIDDLLEYDIAVIGIEMVQVKSGDFYAGDVASPNGWDYRNSSGANFPKLFNSEALQTVGTYNGAAYSLSVPAKYPKGYDEFYCMKYEITQGQYADFLNSIAGAGARWSTGAGNMYNVTNTAGGYSATNGGAIASATDHIDRACGRLSWVDLLSYLDWAALRPMTDFEYEKACRGPLASVQAEYAWGNTIFVDVTTVTGLYAGIEVANANAATVNVQLSNAAVPTGGQFGAGINGPVAAGFFARNGNETRVSAGASYWGIMEMTGNVYEQCVRAATSDVAGAATASTYTGVWGDGEPSALGSYNVPFWPVITTFPDTGPNYFWKGGAFDVSADYNAGISGFAYRNNTDYNIRAFNRGGRGVR